MANSLDTRIAVSNGVIDVTMGGTRATIPVEDLDAFARVLEAMQLLVGGSTAQRTTTVVVEGKDDDDVAAPRRAEKPTLVAVAEPVEPAPANDGKPKRRSRKRVGDALVAWMSDNAGWHSEEKLLQIVTERKMSDASPKRALKIALGKQRDVAFATDGQGNWKLVGDETPAAKPSRSRKKGGKASAKKKRLRAKKPATAEEADDAKQRTVLVKRGEDRKSATMSEGELEAREAASAKLQPPPKGRWGRASPDEVARARRNLLGLGGPSADG